MNQYFKRQLKTPTCFGSFGIHPHGVLKRASLKLLEMFCVRRRSLAAWNLDLWCVFLVWQVENYCFQLATPDTHTTGQNFTLPDTDYAHKTSQVISAKQVLILPEAGSQRIRNISEFLIVF